MPFTPLLGFLLSFMCDIKHKMAAAAQMCASSIRFLSLSQLSLDSRDHPDGNGEIRGQMSRGGRGGIDLTAFRQNRLKNTS
jgi:hypothetical protein